MTNATKAALEASLKKLLLKKPLDKITINDLTTDCGISRMAFYYHFKDIYDLVEWSCLEDATQALQGKKTYETWQEGLQQIFEAVLENKPFIMNVYHSVSREQIETYLFHLTHDLLYGVVQEKAKGTGISEADQSFIADFYKYSFTGVMLDWIKDGMKVDYHMIAEKMHRTMEGNVVNSIRNFEKRNKTINEQISNFAQTYPTNLKASSNEALLFMRRYRFANCSCFSCCFKDAYPSSNVQ